MQEDNMYFRCIWTRNLKEDSKYGFQLAHMLYNYGDKFSGIIQMNEKGVRQVQSILKQRKQLKSLSSYHTKQKKSFHSIRKHKGNHTIKLLYILEFEDDVIIILPKFCILEKCEIFSTEKWINFSKQLLEVCFLLSINILFLLKN